MVDFSGASGNGKVDMNTRGHCAPLAPLGAPIRQDRGEGARRSTLDGMGEFPERAEAARCCVWEPHRGRRHACMWHVGSVGEGLPWSEWRDRPRVHLLGLGPTQKPPGPVAVAAKQMVPRPRHTSLTGCVTTSVAERPPGVVEWPA